MHQTDLLFLKIFVSISAKSHLSSSFSFLFFFFFFENLTFEKNEMQKKKKKEWNPSLSFSCLSVCVPNNNSYRYVLILHLWLSDELVLSFVSYVLLCPHTLLHWFDLSFFTDLEPKLCVILFTKACDILFIISDVWLDWIPWWLRW